MGKVVRNIQTLSRCKSWIVRSFGHRVGVPRVFTISVFLLFVTMSNNNVLLQTNPEELPLLELVPHNTRGVFQIYPGVAGAFNSAAPASTWGVGALQVMQHYSAGMNIQGAAQRLVLAQLYDTPDQFVLLAELGTSDFGTLTSAADLTQLETDPFPIWSIGDSGLQLSLIYNHILVIAPPAALQLVLQVAAGVEDPIGAGVLADYLPAFEDQSKANSFVYGLPALYGAVPPPGSGAASLSQAIAVNGAFNIQNNKLTGAVNFFSANAATYATKLQSSLWQTVPAGYRLPPVSADPGLNMVSVNLNGMSASISTDILPLLKTLFLDMDAVDYAGAVIHGGNAPWMNFFVGEDPGAIFVNYEFKGAAERTAFEAAHLPAGFKLAPIPIVAGEEPRYFMVMNMYQSSGGLVEGARSEWSVFVEDPEDPEEPRFFVLDPKASAISADPVNLLTFGDPVFHVLTATGIESSIYINETDETPSFYSFIDWPQSPETRVQFDRGFMATNDYVFWGGAVADRILYNTTAQDPEAVLVDPDQFYVENNSAWQGYVNEEPVHAVVYLDPQEIVISPWWNLDAPYLDITPEWRQELIDFKNGFYPGTVQGNARKALRASGVVVPVASTVSESVPTAQYHFIVSNPVDLLASVSPVPGKYTSVPVTLFEGEPANHYLTLSVYKREKDPCGSRAEWTTYVVGSGGKTETLRLSALAVEACPDPVSLVTLASGISQSVTNNLLETEILSPFTQFHAVVDLDLADEELTGADWIAAGDRVCTLNSVCDKLYYDGLTILVPALRADSASSALQVLDIATPWDAYIDASSAKVGVRISPSIQALNPWENQRAFTKIPPSGC